MVKQKINIALTVIISVAFVVLGATVFASSYVRFYEALVDFWQSIKYFFCEIFMINHDIVPTVTQYSNAIKWDILLPDDFVEFKSQAEQYSELVFSKNNFIDWCIYAAQKLANLTRLLAILLPFFLIFWLIRRWLNQDGNTNHNKDTLPLRIYKRVTAVAIVPIVSFIKQYIEFIKCKTPLYATWIAIWVFNLNIASMLMGFLAYYFYFSVSYDFSNLYVQFCKLVIDLQVILRTVPLWLLIILAWLVFEQFRKKMALIRLNKLELRNRSLISDLPLVSMTCGSMGKKKTTVITDMALSQEIMFRDIAFVKLKKTDMKFANFPWICFEMELRKCMQYGTVYNLATVKEWIKVKSIRFAQHGNAHSQLYGYDYARYGLTYDDGLKVSNLFEVLETYAQLYFIYVIQSSLIVANYSIREDNLLLDQGNFPLWQSTFFPRKYPSSSRHSHILDFDILRLGKKVIDNNPSSGSFEFGVIVISEVGKERGNNLELSEIKRRSNETNQKNDLFNSWLKMCRHSATVDNYPFIKVFTDEQRPESWGADARDLCEIVNIIANGENRLALPFYTIEDMLTEWVFNWFTNLYYDYRFRRGDNTLLVHLLKGITSWLYKRNANIYNRYGYSLVKMEKERGTMDGRIIRKTYNIMNKKIYSNRFCTDCFSDYFNELAKKSKIGLNDYREYIAEKASISELKLQNSYFINALYKDTDSDQQSNLHSV